MHGMSAFWAGVNSDDLEVDLGLSELEGLGFPPPDPEVPLPFPSGLPLPFPFPSLPPFDGFAVMPGGSEVLDGFLAGPFLKAS